MNKKGASQYALFIVLLIAACLRFYNYSNWSLSNDELSAVHGVSLGTVQDVIQQYIQPDGHPAGVGLFLFYWIKIFGNSEASLRFPFVLAGVLAVFFSYRVGSKWFGNITGLFAALTMAVLEYPILYSQLARPYSFGLLFSMSMVYYWTLLLFDFHGRNKGSLIITYALTATACMYTHYFSFLFSLIAGITGLFFLNKENKKEYLLAGAFCVILFIPHIKLTLEDLHLGGVGWLGKPDEDYLWKYIRYGFNDSRLLLGSIIALCMLSVLVGVKKIQFTKYHFISIAWFIIPFAVGYYYSIYVSPVLQYSVLLFSFPFLLFFLFSFFKQGSDKLNLGLLGLVGILGIYSTVKEKRFYTTHHFGVFKELAVNAVNWMDSYGEKNVTQVINVNHPFYINYYFQKMERKPNFIPYHNNDAAADLYRLKKTIDTCITPYFLYAWSSGAHRPEITEIIKSKYPVEVKKEYYFNSEIYLFGKDKISTGKKDPGVFFSSKNDFEKALPYWGTRAEILTDSLCFSGSKAVRLGEKEEFSPAFEAKVLDIFRMSTDIIHVNVMGYLPFSDADGHIVVAFESNGKTYSWNGVKFSSFIKEYNKWEKAYFSQYVPEIKSRDDILKVYIWNPDKKIIFIDDIEVKVEAGNPGIYGKNEKLEEMIN